MGHELSTSRLSVCILLATGLGACSASEPSETDGAASSSEQGLHTVAATTLRDATGATIGNVVFAASSGATLVTVSARLPAGVGPNGIRGFHVHANDNPANGDGCVADPAQPANTHFVSADGHFNPGGGTHGNHSGDMPALFFTEAGRAAMSFLIDHFTPNEIRGRAVILHQAPDNYANVPVGAAANQYTPNSAEATTLTQNTGNAGNRIGCGVIR